MRSETDRWGPDEGYFFGIGAFETIGIEQGKAMFLGEHLQRLQRAADFFSLPFDRDAIEKKVFACLKKSECSEGRWALKVTLSEKNLLVSVRENTYQREEYERGFSTDLSQVLRNETSPFTYHKTLNYGDCLLEKRLAKRRGVDEPVFCNTEGMICEGATSNIFLVKEGHLLTPEVSCGLLPGIVREYVCEHYEVEEREIRPEEIAECSEMFLTNSLLGIMPVHRFGTYRFPARQVGEAILENYRKLCETAV